MFSPFDLDRQQEHVESKIVVALERISEAFRVLLWNDSRQNGLSPIQIQLLIFVLYHPFEQCNVSFLAREFNMTKATISDSIKILLTKGHLRKNSNLKDTRSFTIALTETGLEIAKASSAFAEQLNTPLTTLKKEEKAAMLHGLLHVIKGLNLAGVITIQRMCFTCANYTFEEGRPFCALLKIPLVKENLRVDCPEHELSKALT